MTTNLNDLASRYLAVWHEADPNRRRSQIEELWIPGGMHFTPTREFSGYEALQARVEEAYGQFVRDKGFLFRLSGEPLGHHAVVKFYWEMIDPRSNSVGALGSDVLRLDESGRIATDHQFIEPLPASP